MVMSGDPIMTPNAYAVTAHVASGIDALKSFAYSSMMPFVPNSPEPMAKVPSARANSVRPLPGRAAAVGVWVVSAAVHCAA